MDGKCLYGWHDEYTLMHLCCLQNDDGHDVHVCSCGETH